MLCDAAAVWPVDVRAIRTALVATVARRIGARRRRGERPEQPTTTPEHVLAAVRGISPATASTLLAEFGSVTAVLEAGPEELARVTGIGPIRARRLHETLTRSLDQRERADRAT